MEDNKQYSAQMALKSLDEAIKKLETEVNEIKRVLNSSSVDLKSKKNVLYVELGRKENELLALKERRGRLNGIKDDVSYRGGKTTGTEAEKSISFGDRRVASVNEKLQHATAKLNVIPANSKNIFLKIMRKRADKAVKKLKAKKGRIEGRQKLITNIKVRSELIGIALANRRTGTIAGHTMIAEKYDALEATNNAKATQAAANNKKIKEIYYSQKALSSQRKANMHRKYVEFLKNKKGCIKGFTKLPDRFKTWLASKVPPVSGLSRA